MNGILIGAITGGVAALVIPAILKPLKLKESVATNVGRFGIIACVILAVNINSHLNDVERAAVKEDLVHLMATQAETNSDAIVENGKTTTPKSNTPKNTYKSSYANYFNQSAELQKKQAKINDDIAKRMSNIDLASTLVPENLVNAVAIRKSRIIIDEYLTLISESEANQKLAQQQNLDLLSNSELPPNERAEAALSYQKNLDIAAPLLSEHYRVQRGIVGAAKEILGLAEKNLGRLSVKNGQIVFETQKQLSIYNEQFGLIMKYSEEETKAINAIAKSETERIARLEKIIGK